MMCMRCRVSGRVQGVFYRASAQQRALALGLTGHARNLPDGRVEVLACGEAEALREFRDWLQQGPRHARVEGVTCEPVEIEPPPDFATG